MSASGELGAPPSRAEVRAKIIALIGDERVREEIANWAAHWVRLPDPYVEDPVVWEALKRLAEADLRQSRDAYLHNDDDFAAWLKDLGES